jgi:hypothetical protein
MSDRLVEASQNAKVEGLVEKSLVDEVWREYDIPGRGSGPYRIWDPVALYYREGGTTHRIVDDKGVVHCVPAPGVNGTVLRWSPRDANRPVQF